MRFKKKEYDHMFGLYADLPWLSQYREKLEELWVFCNNWAEIVLISELLKRFCYISSVERDDCLKGIVSHIVNNWGLPRENTQIVALAHDSEPDSSQWMLYFLKSHFAEVNWESVKMVNQIGKSVKYIDTHPNVILVDDFIGSGKTINSRIKYLSQAYAGVTSSYTIRVCVLACMQNAREYLTASGIELHTEKILKKGITQHYKGKLLRKACKHMLRMEARLDHNNANDVFPFGYKRSEALYSLESANAVNNMFPVFWWPRLSSGKSRIPIFYRKETI